MAKIVATGELASPTKRASLLKELYQKKRSCSFELAVKALKAWGFKPKEKPGNASIAWQFRDTAIMTSFHRPHGGEDMDKGAVAHIIATIEEVIVYLKPKKEDEEEVN